MIMSEKIMSLRKKMGWSQEELANELNVSRQSVSKWETGASIPDMSKVVMLSDIFGVSTDYLLKDSFDDNTNSITTNEQMDKKESIKEEYLNHNKYFVTMEEADMYLDVKRKNGFDIGLGVALCVWSSIFILILEPISEYRTDILSPELADTVGISILFIMLSIAVYIFITRIGRSKKYRYIEEELIHLEYGVEANIRRKKESYEHITTTHMALGIVIIILGIIPTIIASNYDLSEVYEGFSTALLLFMIGLGSILIIRSALIKSSYNKIIEEEDYRRSEKIIKKEIGWFPGVFFSVVTAIYLAYSFVTNDWGNSWIIWPVSAVSFGGIYSYLHKRIKDKIED